MLFVRGKRETACPLPARAPPEEPAYDERDEDEHKRSGAGVVVRCVEVARMSALANR